MSLSKQVSHSVVFFNTGVGRKQSSNLKPSQSCRPSKDVEERHPRSTEERVLDAEVETTAVPQN